MTSQTSHDRGESFFLQLFPLLERFNSLEIDKTLAPSFYRMLLSWQLQTTELQVVVSLHLAQLRNGSFCLPEQWSAWLEWYYAALEAALGRIDTPTATAGARMQLRAHCARIHSRIANTLRNDAHHAAASRHYVELCKAVKEVEEHDARSVADALSHRSAEDNLYALARVAAARKLDEGHTESVHSYAALHVHHLKAGQQYGPYATF